MTGNYSWFSSFTKIENDGNVSFGENSKGKIIGIGNVSNVSFTLIENVCLVENLKHNLLSISQLCDEGYKVIFDVHMYGIIHIYGIVYVTVHDTVHIYGTMMWH